MGVPLAICLAVCLALAASSPAPAAAPATSDGQTCPADPWKVTRELEKFDEEYRLRRDVFPEHYDLKIVANINDGGKFDFEGHVDIVVSATEATDRIHLHSLELEVSPVKVLEEDGGREVPVKSQSLNEENEQLRIELGEKLVPMKKYIIKMDYTGKLGDNLNGLYRSSYYDAATNSTRWLAVTHFEATDARRAFPCFDEPEFKATFTVQVGHNSSLTALSNMPAEKTEPLVERPGFSLTSFPKSVPMSTYLVAIVVSDFYVTKSEEKPDLAQISIWGRRDASDQMAYARELAPKALAFFEEYFDIKYPLPKQDMVAIPDFSAGAMENWGLITYREAQLLYDPKVSSLYSKSTAGNTVIHELAHQWFGNLVTMKWWSDLWLNEGFATYMAAFVNSRLNPDWQYLEDQAVQVALTMLPVDSLESTHPIVRPIEHNKQISQSFDFITYRKGSRVLEMMQSFLGEEVFRLGVIRYLKKHKYGNAEQDDLWAALTEEANKAKALPECLTVKMIMDTWTVQSGYPVVTVDRDYEKGTANISQTRFFSVSSGKRSSSECWYVPLTYTSADKAQPGKASAPSKPLNRAEDWLQCTGKQEAVKGLPGKGKWVLFNPDMRGLYRVQYDQENWRLLTQALADPKERTKISLVSRAQVIMDAFELAQANLLQYSVPLELINTLRHEEEHQPWRVALAALSRLDFLLKEDMRYHNFRDWVSSILKDVFEAQGALKEPANGFQATKQKNLISSWACRMEVGDCIEQAKELFAEWRKSPNPDKQNPIPQDARPLVYCYGIRHGKSQDWYWLWQRYLNSNVASARVTILGALGCSRDLWVLRRYLEWGIDKSSGVRTQDSLTVFSSVTSSEVGYPLAKAFLYRRSDQINEHHGASNSRIGKYISAVASRISTSEEYQELLEYTKKNEKILTQADQTVKQGLENARNNVQWRMDHSDEVFKTIAALNFH